MKRNHLLRIALFGLLLPMAAHAVNYYIKSGGNDTRDGLSAANGWATVARARVHAWTPGFRAGDSLLFEGGKTFTVNGTSEELYFQGNRSFGTRQNPVVIQSYGTGRATILAKSAMFFYGWTPDSASVGLGLVIRNLIIQGDSTPRSGKSADAILLWSDCRVSPDYMLMENLEIRGFGGNGIETGRMPGTAAHIKNIIVRNCVFHDNPGAVGVSPHSGSGIILGGADSSLIEHCLAYNNGANNSNPGGPVGIWFYDCTNSIIQFCESHHNQTIQGDGGGFDLDGGCGNCIIQYCWSHDNAGAGYLLAQFSGAAAYGPLQGNTLRYNISQNDARKGGYGGIMFWGAGGADGVGPNQIYNNTVYMGGTPANGSPSCVYFLGNAMQGVKIRNNIFIAANGRMLVNGPSMDTSMVQFQGNDYWAVSGTAFNITWGSSYATLAAWMSAAAGQEKVGLQSRGLNADPLLMGAGLGTTINNTDIQDTLTAYRPQPTSPIINAGLDLQTLFGISTGSRDFCGTTVPASGGFETGACEHVTTGPELVLPSLPFAPSLWPNPARPGDDIRVAGLGSGRAELFTVSGMKISGCVWTDGTQGVLRTRGLPAGLYLLKVTDSRGDAAKKVLLLK